MAQTTKTYKISVVNQSNYPKLFKETQTLQIKNKTCYILPGCAGSELIKRLRTRPDGFYMHFSSNKRKKIRRTQLNCLISFHFRYHQKEQIT